MASLLYHKKKETDVIECRLCAHGCVIFPGKKGICRVRENKGGTLVRLNRDRIVANSVDPIEKKPIFHLKPGSDSYSIASVGCNFQCSFCQNAHIAQVPDQVDIRKAGVAVSPEQIVAAAIESGCESIAYTYTEPTIFFELALKTAKLAAKKGLYNIFVTNGFMSAEALDLLLPYLSAANIDLKAFNDRFYKKYCKASLEPVKASIEKMADAGTLVELTTLLIPGLNDDKTELRKMADYIVKRLGPQTPWHISRFHPCHRMTDKAPTTVASLEEAWRIGKEAGLYHVYIGNVPGSDYENTFCHNCQSVLIQRVGYHTDNRMEKGGICPKCNTPCHGIF